MVHTTLMANRSRKEARLGGTAGGARAQERSGVEAGRGVEAGKGQTPGRIPAPEQETVHEMPRHELLQDVVR